MCWNCSLSLNAFCHKTALVYWCEAFFINHPRAYINDFLPPNSAINQYAMFTLIYTRHLCTLIMPQLLLLLMRKWFTAFTRVGKKWVEKIIFIWNNSLIILILYFYQENIKCEFTSIKKTCIPISCTIDVQLTYNYMSFLYYLCATFFFCANPH